VACIIVVPLYLKLEMRR